VRNVFPCNYQVIAIGILAAEQYVSMGVVSVPVVDGNPIELRAEVLLHLSHQGTREALKVSNGMAVFWRDDKAEVMSIILDRFLKCLGRKWPASSVPIHKLQRTEVGEYAMQRRDSLHLVG
jgi:hypothetical protein